jgi:hypothetical protein
MSISLSSFSQSKYDVPEQSFIHKVDSYSRNRCSIAFSLKLINKDYTGPIVQVRRVNDAAIQNFYGDDFGNLFLTKNGTSLTSWLNGSIGYVPIWYDQSGNGRNAIQTTDANQSSITESGGLLFNGTTHFFQATSTPIPAGLDTYTFASTFNTNALKLQVVAEQGATTPTLHVRASLLLISDGSFRFNGDANDSGPLIYDTNIERKVVMICNHSVNTGNITFLDNGTVYTSTSQNPALLSVSDASFSIGRKRASSDEYFSGTIKEVIVFNNNLRIPEASLYFTSQGETQLRSSVQPVFQLNNNTKSNYTVQTNWVFQFDTQQLSNKGLSNGTVVSSVFQATATGAPKFYNSSVNPGTYSSPGKTLPNFLNFETADFYTTSTKTFNISTNGGFTAVSYFAFFGTLSNGERVFDFSASTSNPDGNIILIRNATNSGLLFEIYNGTTFIGNVTTPNGSCNQNSFHIWTCRYTNSTKLYEIFRDGILIGSNTGTIFATDRTLANCRISASANGTQNSRMNLVGLYTYDRALNMTEISAISNHLMDCDSNRSIIKMPSNALFNGSVTAQGYMGGSSIRFDGLPSSFIDVQQVPSLPWSITTWVFCTNVNTVGTLMSTTDATRSNYGIEINFNGTGGIYVGARLPTTPVSSTVLSVLNNNWYHIGVVIDLDFTVKFYNSGSLVGAPLTGTALPQRTNRILVGTNAAGSIGMNGYISNFKLYDYALTQNEVFDITNHQILPRRIKKPTQKKLVTKNNWYTRMTLTNASGYVPTIGNSGSDPFVLYKILNSGTTNTTNFFTQQVAIQDFESFQCTFSFYMSNAVADDIFFFCGAPSASTSYGGYNIRFNMWNPPQVSINNIGGSFLKTSHVKYFKDNWCNAVISSKRGTVDTWTVNLNGEEIIVYSDPNNETFRTTTGGNWWGIGARCFSLTMDAYIRRVELEYTPHENISMSKSLPEFTQTSLPIVKFNPPTNTISTGGSGPFNGTYVSSSSSVWSVSAFVASFSFVGVQFTGDAPGWHSAATYNTSTGVYQGSVSTVSSSVAYTGEWLQIQMPEAIQLGNFYLYNRANDRMPINFVVAGSNDNSTWTSLHIQVGYNWTTFINNFKCNQSTNSKYTYFRLVCQNSGTSNIDGIANICNWSLFPGVSMLAMSTIKSSLIPGLTFKNYSKANFSNPNIADNNFYSNNTYINVGLCLDTTSLKTITDDKQGNLSQVFSIEIFGYFKANVSGVWTLATGVVDDAASFWIGNNALVGYTNANANFVGSGGVVGSVSVYLIAGTFYPIRIQYSNGGVTGALGFKFTPPGGLETSNGDGYYFSSNGKNPVYPAESAKIIKDTTGVNEDGVYYILCNGISTPVHCLMNDVYDGGGWMALMKATQGTTFQYSSTHWTTASTLNPTDTTRNNADAKYNTFNYQKVKDVMAIWPDISPDFGVNIHGRNGGSFYTKDGWVWLLNNWTNTATRLTGLAGFQGPQRRAGGELGDFFATSGANDPRNFTGYSTTIWSSMTPVNSRLHFIATSVSGGLRWGFLWNDNPNYDGCDAISGIGMGSGSGNRSAGDWNNGYGSVPGINRQARVEMYGR